MEHKNYSDSKYQEFHVLAQNRASNLLSRKLVDRREVSKDGYYTKSIASEGFKLFIKGYEDIQEIKATAAILLDCLMIKATSFGLKNTKIKLPLKEYMQMRATSDEKEARKQVKRDIDVLERVSFECIDTGNKWGSLQKAAISSETSERIKNSNIVFNFNRDFLDSFKAHRKNEKGYAFMFLPVEALKGNIRHYPYKYWLARKISEQKCIGTIKHTSNANKLRVESLINSCPNFPTYEQTSRNFISRIITPFERDMNELESAFTWEYVGGTPANYEDFLSKTIVFHWKNYPVSKRSNP